METYVLMLIFVMVAYVISILQDIRKELEQKNKK